jgi:hypothetical protein
VIKKKSVLNYVSLYMSASVNPCMHSSRSLGLQGVRVSPLIDHGAFGLRECESPVEMDGMHLEEVAINT